MKLLPNVLLGHRILVKGFYVEMTRKTNMATWDLGLCHPFRQLDTHCFVLVTKKIEDSSSEHIIRKTERTHCEDS